jgi:hypothetical protein
VQVCGNNGKQIFATHNSCTSNFSQFYKSFAGITLALKRASGESDYNDQTSLQTHAAAAQGGASI